MSASAGSRGGASARPRSLAVLLILAAGAIGVIASTQTWLTVTIEDGARDLLPVSGAAALPVLAPLSLTALALGAALAIAGTVLRYVFGVLTVVIAVTLGVATGVVALKAPVAAVVSAVTEATGIAGVEAVDALVTEISTTPWPLITLAACAVLLGAGVLILATAHRWPGAGRKYRTTAEAAAPDGATTRRTEAIDSWDELSRGQDPTV
ncbi:tryptophan-associated transmembrane protein [Microbacterium sp. SLBN-154]|uniref:Trp biosynthesis-associated membrane protein n=1 Tax=Microbacterium sp. SLBN-154 TaxID=2768458 RepID=UPI00115477C7|nr:Trp biosynthesis-associated membrane protein [Microbacterium sp. SLBN-154]TQK19590.1 tryptophan-associated transmembrane protein [Microbacterium sp. SLBN-154]